MIDIGTPLYVNFGISTSSTFRYAQARRRAIVHEFVVTQYGAPVYSATAFSKSRTTWKGFIGVLTQFEPELGEHGRRSLVPRIYVGEIAARPVLLHQQGNSRRPIPLPLLRFHDLNANLILFTQVTNANW